MKAEQIMTQPVGQDKSNDVVDVLFCCLHVFFSTSLQER